MIQKSQFAFHTSEITFSFTKTRVPFAFSSMWSSSEIHPPFLLPTLFNPLAPFPMLQKAAFWVQWSKVSNPWPEARRKPFVPNTMVSQFVLVHEQKQSPSLPTPALGPREAGQYSSVTHAAPPFCHNSRQDGKVQDTWALVTCIFPGKYIGVPSPSLLPTGVLRGATNAFVLV